MITVDVLTIFLGWCVAINIGIFVFTTIMLIILREPISRLYGKLFGLAQEDLALTYFVYLGNFKIAIIVLNVVPYIALKVMA